MATTDHPTTAHNLHMRPRWPLGRRLSRLRVRAGRGLAQGKVERQAARRACPVCVEVA